MSKEYLTHGLDALDITEPIMFAVVRVHTEEPQTQYDGKYEVVTVTDNYFNRTFKAYVSWNDRHNKTMLRNSLLEQWNDYNDGLIKDRQRVKVGDMI